MQIDGYETETMKTGVGDGFPTSAEPFGARARAMDTTSFRI
jgi:hypothetical protein